MPEYALRCPACSHVWDQFAAVSQRAAIRCPKCQAVPETDYQRCNFREGNRVFSTQREMESVVHWVPPADVERVRREYGGANVRDDGTVVFANRSDERAFRKRKQAWEEQQRSANRERAQQALENATPGTLHPDGLKQPLRKRRKPAKAK